MNNLRVNSKTKINEFKRKHNWLVENATIKLNVSNIKSLSNDDIENLRCGDVVLKEDASGKHAYLVTFRNDIGICLTYVDASVVETQSYDLVGDEWVYNSEDKTELGGGTKLYNHHIKLYDAPYQYIECDLITNFDTPLTKSNYKELVLRGSYPTYSYNVNVINVRIGFSPILVALDGDMTKLTYSYINLSNSTYTQVTGQYSNITDTVTEL